MNKDLLTTILSLPRTPEDIAALLASQNITGLQSKTALCPLSVWLRNEGWDHPCVSSVSIIVRPNEPGALDVSVRTPQWVAEFVNNFDEGCYPNLIHGNKS